MENDTGFTAYDDQGFTPYEDPAQKPVTFVQGLARSVASPVMRLGANVAGISRTLQGQTREQAQAPVSYGSYLGSASAVGQQGSFSTKVKDAVGVGTELSSNLIGGGGAKKVVGATLKGLIGQGIKAGAKAGPVAGALYGGGQALQQDKSAGGVALDVGINAGFGLAGGVTFGGASPIAGKAFTKLGNTLREPATELLTKPGQALLKGATWIETKVIRPTRVDIRNGYKKENLAKYGIFGNLGEVMTKTSTQISKAMSELNARISSKNTEQTASSAIQKQIVNSVRTGEQGTTLFAPMQRLASELNKGSVSTFTQGVDKTTVLREIAEELHHTFGPDWHNKTLNFGELVTIKRRVGLKAAFEHDILRKGPSAKEEVWNRLYEILKDETEKQAGKEFGAVNKVISDLIPIEQAIIRRTPIEERNNAIGLIDAISLVGATHEPYALTVGIANRLTKSGAVAKGLGSLGQKMETTGTSAQNALNKTALGNFLQKPQLGMSIEKVYNGANVKQETGGLPGGGKELRATPQAEIVPHVASGANAFNKARGGAVIDHTKKVELDVSRSRRIADAYDKLKVDNSKDPRVARAYNALVKDVQEQWNFIEKKMGIKMEPWKKDGQPYANSAEMIADIKNKKHVYFYTGGEPHAFLDKVDSKTGHTYNEMLRAVHDVFGHAAGGHKFSAVGEENAWALHSQMFSPEGAKALTTETRGQNSWVNYGKQNYSGDVHTNTPLANRPYAVQKVDLLPDEFLPKVVDTKAELTAARAKISKYNYEIAMGQDVTKNKLFLEKALATERELLKSTGEKVGVLPNATRNLKNQNAKVTEKLVGVPEKSKLGAPRERVGTTNQYIGAPKGVTTHQKVTALTSRLTEMAKAGVSGSQWYRKSAEHIMEMFPNKSDQITFAKILAHYSPNSKPLDNFNKALRAFAQYKDGRPVAAGGFKSADASLLKMLDGGGEPVGPKVNAFYHNFLQYIDPESAKADLVTNDIWMKRAFGYETMESKKGGLVFGGLAARQHEFMTKITQKIGSKLNMKPSEVQAAIWVVARDGANMNSGAKIAGPSDFAQAAESTFAQLGWEAAPSKTSGLFPEIFDAPWEQRMDYHARIENALLDDSGRNVIFDLVGLPQSKKVRAPGVFEGEVSPGTQWVVEVPPQSKEKYKVDQVYYEKMQLAAAILGKLTHQDSVAIGKLFPAQTIKDANSALINIGKTFTTEQAKAMDQAMTRAFGAGNYAIPGNRNGLQVLNFTDLSGQQFRDKLQTVVDEVFGDATVKVDLTVNHGELVGKAKSDYGEDYMGAFAKGTRTIQGGSEVLRGVQEQIERVIQESKKQFGWTDGRKEGDGIIIQNPSGKTNNT